MLRLDKEFGWEPDAVEAGTLRKGGTPIAEETVRDERTEVGDKVSSLLKEKQKSGPHIPLKDIRNADPKDVTARVQYLFGASTALPADTHLTQVAEMQEIGAWHRPLVSKLAKEAASELGTADIAHAAKVLKFFAMFLGGLWVCTDSSFKSLQFQLSRKILGQVRKPSDIGKQPLYDLTVLLCGPDGGGLRGMFERLHESLQHKAVRPIILGRSRTKGRVDEKGVQYVNYEVLKEGFGPDGPVYDMELYEVADQQDPVPGMDKTVSRTKAWEQKAEKNRDVPQQALSPAVYDDGDESPWLIVRKSKSGEVGTLMRKHPDGIVDVWHNARIPVSKKAQRARDVLGTRPEIREKMEKLKQNRIVLGRKALQNKPGYIQYVTVDSSVRAIAPFTNTVIISIPEEQENSWGAILETEAAERMRDFSHLDCKSVEHNGHKWHVLSWKNGQKTCTIMRQEGDGSIDTKVIPWSEEFKKPDEDEYDDEE